jgi:CO/xanthine dehydrogenase Mo-binding subunit
LAWSGRTAFAAVSGCSIAHSLPTFAQIREEAEVAAAAGHLSAQVLATACTSAPTLTRVRPRGQMCGGVAQALGWAFWEELVHDEQRHLVTGTLVDYALPTATVVPAIDTEIVEVPVPEEQFGAEGVG